MICRNPLDLANVRNEILADINRTMLWSGAKEPMIFHNSDGSLWVWTEHDLERAPLWASEEQLKKMKVGGVVEIDNYYGSEINCWNARRYGKETIDMALERLDIRLPEYDTNNSNSILCWEAVSQIWVENARGEVGISAGESIRETSIFARKEFDIIKANMKVTSIALYDNWPVAAHGKETKVFTRKEFEKMQPFEFVLY